jgi:uncharacterized protein (DUF2147 family)
MCKSQGGTGLKKTMALFLALFVVTVICLAADPVEGYWLSIDEKTGKVTAGWQIYQEGGKLFGKIVSMADYPGDVLATPCKDSYAGFPLAGRVSQMPVMGTPWIFGLSAGKPGEWSGGSIINPEDGKMYKCKIIYRNADGRKYITDVLEMRGEIGLGIGRSQFWQKSDQQTASSLRP